MVSLSSNEAIDNIKAPDDDVEVRGYVDTLIGRQVVGVKNLSVYKFILNNGSGRRIQCLAWEQEINRVESIIAMDKILHIEAGQAKLIQEVRYNRGNTPFELKIRNITEITDLGFRDVPRNGDAEIADATTAEIVTWDEIAEKKGKLITVDGWVKCNIRESRYYNNESTFGFGSITNGESKLEIRIASFSGLPDGLSRGSPVKVTGIVHFKNYLYLQLARGSDVEVREDERMDPENMLEITAPPNKRRRIEI